jgi:hypothetical protein
MARTISRRVVCAGAILALCVATAPPLRIEAAAPAPSSAVAPASGQGWGSMIACAACVVAAGAIIAGGPVAVTIAVNAPGSAMAVIACAGACYEAFE